jgi:hypothetical protein
VRQLLLTNRCALISIVECFHSHVLVNPKSLHKRTIVCTRVPVRGRQIKSVQVNKIFMHNKYYAGLCCLNICSTYIGCMGHLLKHPRSGTGAYNWYWYIEYLLPRVHDCRVSSPSNSFASIRPSGCKTRSSKGCC